MVNKGGTLKSLIIVPVLLKKTHPNLLRYSLFLAVLLERIRDFLLRYFYLSGTITLKVKELQISFHRTETVPYL